MTAARSDHIYITFWGTRGSVPTPGNSTEKYGGNTPCVSIQYQDIDIILDAGTGIRNLGLELMQRKENLNLHLLLSHTHWDHIQGLPFFAPAYSKDTNLSIHGSPQKESFLAGILQGQMDVNYFPVEMNALSANLHIQEIKAETFKIGPVKVDLQEQVCHPGGSVRYRLDIGGKKIVYATDVELDKIFSVSKSASNKEIRKLRDDYNEFIDGADLLIADAQYTLEEYPSKKEWGHTSIPVVLECAHKRSIQQLALFHHDPQHSDAMIDKLWKKYSPQYTSSNPMMNAFWAREGMTLAI